jgi:uncharacterized protein
MRGNIRLVAVWCGLALALLGPVPVLTSAGHAQTEASGAVTVFTDGLAYPDGVISKALAELSANLEEADELRLLSIMGKAGAANVRDLLRFRGADFAIINSDALAFAEVAKAYPEAGEKLRYIARLRKQKAILLARSDIDSIQQLAGKKVVAFGPDMVTGQSARTVFAALGVKADITSVQDGSAEEQLGPAAAIFLFDTDAKRLPSAIARSADFHLIAIPISPALAKFYRSAQVQPSEFGDRPGSDSVSSIETDTILASFNWNAQSGRYADVTAFVDHFFEALPRLRSSRPFSIWNETDPRAPVLGWKQFPYAATAARTVPAPPSIPVATAPAVVPRVGQAGAEPKLRLSIVPQPPLTDEHANGGGLLTELTKAALERTDWPPAAHVEVLWDKDRASQTHGVLVEKRADLAMPWPKPSCEEPAMLTGESAALCDGALASEPIFKALVVFFTKVDSDFDATSEERLSGRTICVPANRDLAPPADQAERMIRDGRLKLVRPASMIDCLNLVGHGDADALLINELEGKRSIADLGLSQAFRMVENAGSAQEIRIVIAKGSPKAQELLSALNKGIAKLKSEELYSQIVMKHLVLLNRLATVR